MAGFFFFFAIPTLLLIILFFGFLFIDGVPDEGFVFNEIARLWIWAEYILNIVAFFSKVHTHLCLLFKPDDFVQKV